MNRKSLAVALVLSAPLAGLWMVGCGDDEVFQDADAATPTGDATPGIDAPVPDAGPNEASTPSTCGDAAGAPERLLLSINNSSTSELAAFNVAGKAVDGRFTYPGFIGLSYSPGADPYLLEQANDVVAKMDAQHPWQVLSSWSVAGTDATDGGSSYSDPSAVIVPDCTTGYVFRYKRNKVALIDTTQTADAGAPTSFLDLSALVQTTDKDGLVDMTNAVYVASKKRIYVLLGNEDLTKVAPDGYTILCTASTPSIVAIDTTTGALVSLGGTAPGGGIALAGYNPPLGPSLAYDALGDRLLVLEGGCNADVAGVAGPVQQRLVESVDLTTSAVTTLLSLNDQQFPAGLIYADSTHAAVTFFGAANFWNPTTTTLGAAIPGGFDFGASDGKGNLIGARATYLLDGGAGPIQVVSVPFDGGTDAAATTTLGENPFTNNGGFMSGAELWPHN